MSKRKLLLTITVFVVCFMLSGAAAVFADEVADTFVGKPVPSFKAKDLDGNEKDISSYKGKTVLINFWGLRCGSCIQEMPHLNALNDKFKDKGLVILGINADGVGADFLKSDRGMVNLPLQMNYTTIEDPEMALIDLFKMEAAPLNILIDTEGIVRYYHMGFEDGDEKTLNAKVESVIK